jgi:serine/threonine-protein kinase
MPGTSSVQLRIGSTFGDKWRLDAVLGVGGMAAVYAATHRNGQRAALKILHPEFSSDREWRKRFLREGRVANAVGHEGAVQVLDDDVTADGSVFLVLELLEGENLVARRRRLGGCLPEREVLWIGDQLLDVLVAAHARGIVHRDIKPANLLLTCSGRLKVLDFGIARMQGLSTASTATHKNRAMGTPAFLAPEQARGLWEEVDAQSDLFATGATMFFLLSGLNVHDRHTQNDEMVRAMTVPARPIASVSPGVAETVARVIDGALAFEKSERWPSALSMQEAIRHAYYDRAGSPIATAPPPYVPDAVASPMGGSETDTSVSEGMSPAIAKAVDRTSGSWKRLVAAVAVSALGVVAIAVARARSGDPGPTRGATACAPEPLTMQEVPAPSASLVAPDLHAASPVGTAKTQSTTTASAKPGCATPFVIDPTTHIKHWKLECL